jgi:hypothetical protein
MTLVNPNSLAATLANINDAVFRGDLPAGEREPAAEWIASRVGVFGSYRGLPAPTGKDRHKKLRLYTGELVGSHAGTGCKLGFEATWALAVLHPKKASVQKAAQACRDIAVERFAQETARRRGMYCCYSCSVAGWRALGSAGQPQADKLLEAGLALLRGSRLGNGRWDKFPFWYTVLALSDLETPEARAELRHAAAVLEQFIGRRQKPDATARRRRLLAKHVLERVA